MCYFIGDEKWVRYKMLLILLSIDILLILRIE